MNVEHDVVRLLTDRIRGKKGLGGFVGFMSRLIFVLRALESEGRPSFGSAESALAWASASSLPGRLQRPGSLRVSRHLWCLGAVTVGFGLLVRRRDVCKGID